jgi:hypothetical protein
MGGGGRNPRYRKPKLLATKTTKNVKNWRQRKNSLIF